MLPFHPVQIELGPIWPPLPDAQADIPTVVVSQTECERVAAQLLDDIDDTIYRDLGGEG